MRALVYLIPVVAPVLGFWLGTKMTGKSRLPKHDQKELNSLRALRDDLMMSASEHATLGSDYAVIVLGRINQSRKELR